MGQTSRPADQPGEAKRSNQQNIHRFKRGQTCAIGRRGVGASYHPLRTEEKRVRRTARLTRAPIGRAPARSSRRGGAEGEEAAPGGGLGVGGGDRVPLAGSIVSPAGNVRGGWKGRSRGMGLGTSSRPPFCCQLIWRVALSGTRIRSLTRGAVEGGRGSELEISSTGLSKRNST